MEQRRAFGGIRRLIAAAVLCCALLGLSAESAQAGRPAPGCSPAMWGLQVNFADMQRLKDFALSTILKQADTALGVTCFDQALALSSRLGAIFSDLTPDKISAVIKNVIAGQVKESLYNVSASFLLKDGKPNTLADAYKNVMGDTLTSYLGGGIVGGVTNAVGAAGNFAQSLTAQMGSTVTGALQGLVGKILSFFNGVSAAGNSIIGMAGSVEGMIDTIFNIIETAQKVICVLGVTANPLAATIYAVASTLVSIIAIIDQVVAAITQILDAVNALKAGLLDIMNAASLLGSPMSSLSGLAYDQINGIVGPLPFNPADFAQVPGLPSVALTATGPKLPKIPSVNSLLNTASNAFIPPGCKQMMAMWKGAIDGNGAMLTGILGGGPTKGIPAFTYKDLVDVKVTRQVPGASPVSSGNLMEALLQPNNTDPATRGVNDSILTAAGNDLTNLLGAPGTLPFWHKTTVGSGSSVTAIVQAMQAP